MTGRPRSIALDVLRALAILLVIGAHTQTPDASQAVPPLVRSLYSLWASVGWAGVDLFFVLSGFLVSGLLFDEQRARGSLSISRFLVRRGLRIYPAFYVYTACVIALCVVLGRELTVANVAAELLFFQNYVRGPYWGHTWSLAVEEHFYLLLPLLLVALHRFTRDARDPFRSLIVVYAVVAGVCLVLRCATALEPYALRPHVYATHLRIDSLLLGVVLAWLHHYRRAQLTDFIARRRVRLLAGGAACVAPVALVSLKAPFMHTFGFLLLALGCSAIVIVAVAVESERARPWGGRALASLAFIGQHSYSIYLWHRLVLVHGRAALADAWGARPPFVVEVALTTAGALAFGIAMSKLIEIPVLRLRDRWFPAR